MTVGAGTPDPGEQQRRAAHPKRSVWVSASAGTGKTKVLTDRVLSLLLTGTRPDRILCLTFTRAAAAEMSNRLHARLGRWAAASDDQLTEEIVDLTGEAPGEETLTRARQLFAHVLDVPGGLTIETIHAFCQSVLQRFPIEAGLAPHFEVTDERTAAEMLQSVQNALIASAREEAGSPLSEAISHIAGLVQEGAFAGLMAQIASDRGRQRRLIDRHGGLEGALLALRKTLGLPRDASLASLIGEACSDEAFDHQRLRRVCAALAEGSDAEKMRGAAIAAWLADKERRQQALPTYRAEFLTTKGELRKRLVNKSTLVRCPDAEEVLAAEAERLAALDDRCRAVAVYEATAALMRFGREMIDRYQAAKAARGLLDYDDLVLRTRELVHSVGAGWALYKLDGGIDHILIDEAQDTNPDQWEVVRALAEEFFAGTSARDIDRTIFAVGDPKQSIFSFQRADPAWFDQMRRFFGDRCQAVGSAWEEIGLEISFRSAPAVLRTVDAVFATAAREGVVPEGLTLLHQPFRHGHAGLVEMWPPAEPAERGAIDPWTAPTEYRSSASAEARLATIIASKIAEWLRTGEILESRGRPVRPGDIMILVRRRTAFVEDLVRALKVRNVPVAGVDRIKLTEQLAVQDLISLGQFLLMPEDDLTLAVVLKSPLIGLDEGDLFDLAYDRGASTLWRRLADSAAAGNARHAKAHATLSDLMARVDFGPPHALFAHVLGALGGRKALVARLGHEANDPIDEFLAQALAYGRANIPSMQGFLHWISAGEGELKRDLEQTGRDEVRIITVHGAKGLQAPIVFVPDTMQTPTRVPSPLWHCGEEDEVMIWCPRAGMRDSVSAAVQREAERLRDEEYRRLLYVALTRAEDRLYICGWKTAKTPPSGNWYDLVHEALSGIAEPIELDFTLLHPLGWQGPGLRLTNPQTTSPASDTREPQVRGPAPDLPKWATEPVAGFAPPRPALAPSRLGEDEPPVISPLGRDSGQRFRRGLLIHRLLQTLPEVDPARRETAARLFLARSQPALGGEEIADIVRVSLGVIEHPEFAPVFSSGSRAEVAVNGTLDGQPFSGQIDRLCVTGNSVLIVDYKSNRPPPRNPAAVPAVYLRQMAAYRALLHGIYPEKEVVCGLLWTETPSLMRLDPVVLDHHAPSAVS